MKLGRAVKQVGRMMSLMVRPAFVSSRFAARDLVGALPSLHQAPNGPQPSKEQRGPKEYRRVVGHSWGTERDEHGCGGASRGAGRSRRCGGRHTNVPFTDTSHERPACEVVVLLAAKAGRGRSVTKEAINAIATTAVGRHPRWSQHHSRHTDQHCCQQPGGALPPSRHSPARLPPQGSVVKRAVRLAATDAPRLPVEPVVWRSIKRSALTPSATRSSSGRRRIPALVVIGRRARSDTDRRSRGVRPAASKRRRYSGTRW